MQTKLPNLNALRVLIQVARLGSFTSAAEALRVTQSAVSKQIATLESDLGQPLFHRFHKRIEITPFGQNCGGKGFPLSPSTITSVNKF